ncbi:ABC transporter ATP-binding protein [Paraburkholderia susongensis]|uniref:Peptide/nickel transport system ATP-binding protein/oligopeptide transport system ATP-binding protein n=1 Tax=Paraburkholderia susongensis TaxID=1515439 RepID=A0A1X7I345_9BURK|nr:oligopeptide/dipeptide ABC transporter ATP-binding protein [Paraburkholderia susongensis]SMG08374.1 peptide/nickel transport system ATP-binding protein/oligopeptide transport system ATP-binding protein [Paraburkholderia susongensis]
MPQAYLSVRNLRKTYDVRRGLLGRARPLHAVAGVTFDVEPGATFGLVGESGSGKSTIARMLMLAEPATSGEVKVDGQDIRQLSAAARERFHRVLQPVLQDPYSALNPRMRIGRIIDEPLRIHRVLDDAGRASRVAELLQLVGLPGGTQRKFPHELSGGQRQRVAIARALSLNPRCMILDEPVSALDVSIQAQILNLLKDLQGTLDLTYLLISHDLAVVAYMSQRIGVLYLGEFMEMADTATLMRGARHPYTQALIASVDARGGNGAQAVAGEIPSPMNPPSGCPFHPRCPHAAARCREEKPVAREIAPRHWVTCHFAETIPAATANTAARAVGPKAIEAAVTSAAEAQAVPFQEAT